MFYAIPYNPLIPIPPMFQITIMLYLVMNRCLIIHPIPKSRQKKRGWWIFALVVAALALTVIFFRVYKNGFVTSAAGNQQRINAAPWYFSFKQPVSFFSLQVINTWCHHLYIIPLALPAIRQTFIVYWHQRTIRYRIRRLRYGNVPVVPCDLPRTYPNRMI